MIKINTIKKKLICSAIVAIIASLIVFVFITSSQKLYTVRTSFIVTLPPIKTNLDINKYLVSYINNKHIADSISKYCEESGITTENYTKRISIGISQDKLIKMNVSATTEESAIATSELLIDLMNKKIISLIKNQSENEIKELTALIDNKKTQIDSLKQVINNLQKSESQKLFSQKNLLENNPEYLFAKYLMEKYANDYGFLTSQYYSIRENMNENVQHITVMNPMIAKSEESSKLKYILITAFISFICSLCLLSFVGNKQNIDVV